MIGNASRAIDDRSLGTDQVDVQTRIHFRFHQHGGLWFGGGVARPWRVAVFSAADVTDAGAWGKLGSPTAKFGDATMTATFTNFAFSKIASVHDTGSAQLSCASGPMIAAAPTVGRFARLFTESSSGGACERQSRFGDLEGSLHWEVGRVRAHGADGPPIRRLVRRHRRFAPLVAATATIWLSDRIAIVGGGGRQPALPLRGLPAQIVRNGRARARVLADVQERGAGLASACDARQKLRDATRRDGDAQDHHSRRAASRPST